MSLRGDRVAVDVDRGRGRFGSIVAADKIVGETAVAEVEVGRSRVVDVERSLGRREF